MKFYKWIMGIAAVTMLVALGSPKAEAKKALVLYYSQTSNTKAVAQEIAKRLKADIEEIVPVKPYDGDFQATIDRCKQDQKDGVKPKIKPLKSKLKKYEVIFLGFPVWFGTYAPPIASFLDKVDLSGKTIVPFCTFGSGGLESSAAYLAQAQPKAKILDGYGVRAARMDAMPKEVDQFLKASGFLKGQYVKLADFPAQHVVSDEESAIFDAAVGDYPMINAKAMTVASRTIPNGMEYLFTAADKPRKNDSNLQMRPPVEMKVYVTVLDGKAPVFTKVVR